MGARKQAIRFKRQRKWQKVQVDQVGLRKLQAACLHAFMAEGWQYGELADEVGCDIATTWAFLNGKTRYPRVQTAINHMVALGFEVQYTTEAK